MNADAVTGAARAAGILLHPTSFPGAHGIGDLGDDAYRFIDWLAAAKQRVWQVLPLGPTGFGNSPYAARSAFAGSPLLISLQHAQSDGLLSDADLAAAPRFDPDHVTYSAAEAFKFDRLRRACARLQAPDQAGRVAAYAAFCAESAAWLDDFALYMALRDAHRGAPWTAWEPAIRGRERGALAAARTDLAGEIGIHRLLQFFFREQWHLLKAYANARGVRIMGDLPIFVAHDSADVWAHPELFHLDAEGLPTVVAGVPPDYFSVTGQRWGNPLYRWDALAATGYTWWIDRFRHLLQTVDMVRIDHFRGFEQYWAVPAGHETAQYGEWQPGPGAALFQAIEAALGPVPLVAEDLGTITPEVHALRRGLGIPGMRVLQFAFGGDVTNPYLPHNYEHDTVVYTGTHDNDTTAGWFASLDQAQRFRVLAYLASDGHDLAHDLVRLAYQSVASLAIVPLQDVLNLGTEARMNLPGRAEGNWGWRYRSEALHDDDARWLAELSETYGRVAATPAGES
jgi:4-alpha-glucanotransferase